jgi:hypothetical protein
MKVIPEMGGNIVLVFTLSVPDEGYFERTWWRLFGAYLMKVIWSVPDEGYFERTWWRLFGAYLMKVIWSIPDEGYLERTWWRLFWAYLMKVILSVPDEGYFERTWWRLFQKYVVRTTFDVYVSIPDVLSDCPVYIAFLSPSPNHPLFLSNRRHIIVLYLRSRW